MRDLKRYITKKVKLTKKSLFDIENKINELFDENISIAFITYLLFNSFSKQIDITEEHLHMLYEENMLVDGELYYEFSLSERENMHLDDVFDTSNWFGQLVLDAIFPHSSYQKKDFLHYLENEEDDQELDECFKYLEVFCKENKLSKKIMNKIKVFFKENRSEPCEFRCEVIRSPFLKKIYCDKELKELFEDALCGCFINSTTILNYSIIYNELCDYCDGELLSSSAIRKLVEKCKEKFKYKRKMIENFESINNLLNCANLHNLSFEIILDCEKNFDTKEQVMF